ncbi:DUF2563 family protein [Mycolicibacterium komossense]|uniref:DUF2563 family protein n=2 Tax=Mycolicibacterium komossense TaxID=1779 RepID=A0ABT3CL26_9MYCO|nr:DUF2563 family protein [Mycolicibacterium komossense]
MRTGANTTFKAADHANDGAGYLRRASVNSGIFGDFDAAQEFHDAVTDAHSRHTEMLNKHSEILDQLGNNAHNAASEFAEMDADNGKRLHDVAKQL